MLELTVRTRRRPAGRLVAAGVALAILAGCAGSEDEAAPAPEPAAPAEEAPAEPEVEIVAPVVAYTSPVQASYVNTRVGPLEYGSDFGIEMTLDDLVVFDSHSTATQTALSGRADVIGGSFISHVLARESGIDLQVFCPFVSLDTLSLVGRNGVDSVDDFFDPKTRVAIDSPGGAGAMSMNALLKSQNAPGFIPDLPNVTILDSSGLRTTAFAANEVDATVIHSYQLAQVIESGEVPDGVLIATLYEDVPVFIKEAYAAPKAWLDENPESAARFCASIITANRQLTNTFSGYKAAVEKYVEKPPSEEVLEAVFKILQGGELWPVDGGLPQDAVEYMVELAVLSGGLFEGPVTQDVSTIVNRDILARAVQLADER